VKHPKEGRKGLLSNLVREREREREGTGQKRRTEGEGGRMHGKKKGGSEDRCMERKKEVDQGRKEGRKEGREKGKGREGESKKVWK
jgi:hypothetical protein